MIDFLEVNDTVRVVATEVELYNIGIGLCHRLDETKSGKSYKIIEVDESEEDGLCYLLETYQYVSRDMVELQNDAQDITMTKKEFMQDYGDALVKFTSYYKYIFTFTGLLDDGGSIAVIVGGAAADIYKLPVNAGAEMTIASLPDVPFSGHVLNEDGAEVDSFYER